VLNNYIQDLTISGKLSKHNIEDAKHEQSKILNELKTIQKGLDGIMNDTNDINVNLKQKNLI
jgi:flagellar biosynthesis chaperone FliJ